MGKQKEPLSDDAITEGIRKYAVSFRLQPGLVAAWIVSTNRLEECRLERKVIAHPAGERRVFQLDALQFGRVEDEDDCTILGTRYKFTPEGLVMNVSGVVLDTVNQEVVPQEAAASFEPRPNESIMSYLRAGMRTAHYIPLPQQ